MQRPEFPERSNGAFPIWERILAHSSREKQGQNPELTAYSRCNAANPSFCTKSSAANGPPPGPGGPIAVPILLPSDLLEIETHTESCRGTTSGRRRRSPACRTSRHCIWSQTVGLGPAVFMIERRCLRRFKLVVPVLYRWRDGEEGYDVGCCRDISSAGIFVVTAHCPPLHCRIDVEVVLPAFDPLASEVRLCCVGQVVRVQARDNLVGFGFAVAGPF